MLLERRRKLRDDDTGESEVDGESARPPVKERCRYLIEILIISLQYKYTCRLGQRTWR